MNNEDIEKLKKQLDGGELNHLSTVALNSLIEALYQSQHRTFRDYMPQSYQLPFHIAPEKTRLFIAANRTGKTLSGICEDLWHLTGEYPEWYPHSQRWVPPVFGRYVATDFKEGVAGVFQPYIDELLPRGYIKRILKTPQGIYQKLFFNNGSILEVLTREQDTNVFEGWHGHFLHCDEPIQRDKYVASIRGLIDFNGRVWFTMTPLAEQVWVYDELFLSESKEVSRFYAVMEDNKYISKEAQEEFISHLTEDEKLARVHGKFMHLSGLIYKEFNTNIHVVDDYEYPGGYKIVFVLDPHDRKAHCGIWLTVDTDDNLCVIKEIKFKGTLQELVMEIKRQELTLHSKVALRIIDPNKGRSPSYIGDRGTIVDEFRKLGMHFYDKVADGIPAGHLIVSKYLYYNRTKPLGYTNKPRLTIFKSCKETIKGMTHYIWVEDKNPNERDAAEKPRDLYKDFPDVIRYACVADLHWHTPSSYRYGYTEIEK